MGFFFFLASDLNPVQVPLMQTPLGQTDSESDTDSSSSYSTPPTTAGESTNEETTAETRPLHSERSFSCKRRGGGGGGDRVTLRVRSSHSLYPAVPNTTRFSKPYPTSHPFSCPHPTRIFLSSPHSN